MGVGAGLYMCDDVKKVHVRYLISWWVLVRYGQRKFFGCIGHLLWSDSHASLTGRVSSTSCTDFWRFISWLCSSVSTSGSYDHMKLAPNVSRLQTSKRFSTYRIWFEVKDVVDAKWISFRVLYKMACFRWQQKQENVCDRSIRYASPCLWNQLPSSLRQPHSSPFVTCLFMLLTHLLTLSTHHSHHP